jgi:hypothetical protein
MNEQGKASPQPDQVMGIAHDRYMVPIRSKCGVKSLPLRRSLNFGLRGAQDRKPMLMAVRCEQHDATYWQG